MMVASCILRPSSTDDRGVGSNLEASFIYWVILNVDFWLSDMEKRNDDALLYLASFHRHWQRSWFRPWRLSSEDQPVLEQRFTNQHFFSSHSHCCCYQHNCNACPWTLVHKNEFSFLLVPRIYGCYLVLLFTHQVFWSCWGVGCCVFDGSLFLCLTVLQLLLGRRWWVVVVAVEGLLGKVLKGSLSCPWCLSPFQQ